MDVIEKIIENHFYSIGFMSIEFQSLRERIMENNTDSDKLRIRRDKWTTALYKSLGILNNFEIFENKFSWYENFYLIVEHISKKNENFEETISLPTTNFNSVVANMFETNIFILLNNFLRSTEILSENLMIVILPTTQYEISRFKLDHWPNCCDTGCADNFCTLKSDLSFSDDDYDVVLERNAPTSVMGRVYTNKKIIGKRDVNKIFEKYGRKNVMIYDTKIELPPQPTRCLTLKIDPVADHATSRIFKNIRASKVLSMIEKHTYGSVTIVYKRRELRKCEIILPLSISLFEDKNIIYLLHKKKEGERKNGKYVVLYMTQHSRKKESGKSLEPALRHVDLGPEIEDSVFTIEIVESLFNLMNFAPYYEYHRIIPSNGLSFYRYNNNVLLMIFCEKAYLFQIKPTENINRIIHYNKIPQNNLVFASETEELIVATKTFVLSINRLDDGINCLYNREKDPLSFKIRITTTSNEYEFIYVKNIVK